MEVHESLQCDKKKIHRFLELVLGQAGLNSKTWNVCATCTRSINSKIKFSNPFPIGLQNNFTQEFRNTSI